MAVDDFPVAPGEHRDFEAELANAAAHAIHRGVVLAGIASVEDELFDGPLLNARLRRLRNYSTPHQETELVWRILPEGALCARLSNRASK
jgi:hypothetical protein